jgi:predicted RNase H-like nuclease
VKRHFDHFCGIDPSWTGKKPTAVSVLDRQFRLVDFVYSKDIERIVQLLRNYENTVIGVDAPLVIRNETGHRPNEKEFLKHFARFGLSLYPVNRRRYPFFFPVKLYEALKTIGYSFQKGNIFEVYPHATILVLFNNMRLFHYKKLRSEEKLEKLEYLRKKIETFIEIPDGFDAVRGDVKSYEDFLDSLVCAITVGLASERSFLTFGNEDVGILLVLTP